MRRVPWPRTALPTAPGHALAFIADAHLDDAERSAYADFCACARSLAGQTLVLLGDLFHMFPGPEIVRRPQWAELLACLGECARSGCVYFLPGNRDFQAGSILNAAAGTRELGETVRFSSGGRCVYACHGDQLCQDDVLYQRMKRVIRNPVLVGAWMRLPSACRGVVARVLRAFTLRSLRTKPAPQLLPSPDVVRWLCTRGADLVVSGHRHASGRTVYEAGGRTCVHYELPAWCDERSFLRVCDGEAELIRFGG